jgi:hypothetical protein
MWAGILETGGGPIPRLKRHGVDVPHTTRGPGTLSFSFSFLFFILCFGFAFSKFEKIRSLKKLKFEQN